MSCTSSIASVTVPGPAGPAGANGTNGTNGVNAFTTCSSFIMPAEGANVTLTVGSSAWCDIGEIVYIAGGGAKGWFEVQSKPSSTQLSVKNVENTGSGAYTPNSPPGTIFPAASTVQPAGLQGPSGVVPGGVLLAVNNLSDVIDAGESRIHLGLGTAAQHDIGRSDGNAALNDGDLTAGRVVVSTVNGISTPPAATARADLGLGTSALFDQGNANNKLPKVDDVAGLTIGETVFATANGVESVDAATARSRLGVVGTLDMLLYEHQTATGVDGALVTAGGWTTVPLTNEVVDTGNHGTLAANQVTLDAGIYRYRFFTLLSTGDTAMFLVARLWNITDGAIIAASYGTTGYVDPPGGTFPLSSTGCGRFTLPGAKTLRIECQIPAGKVAIFGKGAAYGVNNVFSWWELWKE